MVTTNSSAFFSGAGADPDPVAEGHFSPLFLAAYNNHKAIVQALLEARVEVNRQAHNGQTALHHAARHLNEDVVVSLLDAVADPNLLDEQGRTPLHYAATTPGLRPGSFMQTGTFSMTEKAVEFGGASGLSVKGPTSTIRLLVRAGAGVDTATTEQGWTPLHFAAFANNPSTALVLLESGACSEIADSDGRRPLELAREMGHTLVSDVLLNHGAAADPESSQAD